MTERAYLLALRVSDYNPSSKTLLATLDLDRHCLSRCALTFSANHPLFNIKVLKRLKSSPPLPHLYHTEIS